MTEHARFIVVDLEWGSGVQLADCRDFFMLDSAPQLGDAKDKAALYAKARAHRCGVVDWLDRTLVHEVDPPKVS